VIDRGTVGTGDHCAKLGNAKFRSRVAECQHVPRRGSCHDPLGARWANLSSQRLSAGSKHGFNIPQVFDSAADPLSGEILERARLEDGVDMLRHYLKRRRITDRLQSAADPLGCCHDPIGVTLGRPHWRFEFQAAALCRRHRRSDNTGNPLMDSRKLRQGVACQTVFADAPVYEAAEVVEQDVKFGVNAGRHEFIKVARWLCRC
jgi:hypothetical protein